MAKKSKTGNTAALENLPAPTPWPTANARLLGVGAGLPVAALDRLANFSAKDFERFTLEWAAGYLAEKLYPGCEIQQRAGAGDKGRDVIVWLDPVGSKPRRWVLYQCKHYADRLGHSDAAAEIAKVLYYTFTGEYTVPEEYWFVTHKGMTGPLQDDLDDPEKLRSFILANWDKHCAGKITSRKKVALEDEFKAYVEAFPFQIFRAKQPHEIISEHSQTRYHLVVFGAPLIDRPPPPVPPSEVAPAEIGYVNQLFAVISEQLNKPISGVGDFADDTRLTQLFDRSRLTFYSAEGLKELARDQMSDAAYFDTLLQEFQNGLYHVYTADYDSGLDKLRETVRNAQQLQLRGHVLSNHVTTNDCEGACHQLANAGDVTWCDP